MNKCLIIILASLSLGALAEEESIDCNNAMTIIEINQCAAIELRAGSHFVNRYDLIAPNSYLHSHFEHN